VLRWDGTGFSSMSLPIPVFYSLLHQVSCASDRFCMMLATDGSFSSSDSYLWNGENWAKATAGPPFEGLFQGDLSCWSPTGCMAVRASPASATSPQTAVARRWDGQVWTDVAVPDLPDTNTESFRSVSCPAEDFCAAVGQIGNRSLDGSLPTVADGLAATWDGSAWTLVTMPRAAGSAQAELTSVSCADRSFCTAIGSALSPAPAAPPPMTSVWRDNRWWNGPSFPAEGRPAALVDVSCREGHCLALGNTPVAAHYTPGG
jgi:hypothetical protein